jgi:histidine phosphotransferase ChpT
MTSDIRVAELLCSRLCHDLGSGIGAINNGIELITDFGAELSDDAVDLIGLSASQLSERLQFFRLAYGRGGYQKLPTVAAVAAAAEAVAAQKQVTVATEGEDASVAEGHGKLLLNMIAIAVDALLVGGTVAVERRTGDGRTVLQVTARGDRVSLDDGVTAALAPGCPVEAVDPANVHAFCAQRLAAVLETEIKTRQEANGWLILFVDFPAMP